MLDAYHVGSMVGEKAAGFLQPWKRRIGLVIFLFCWWQWGIRPALVLTSLYAGVIWWRGRNSGDDSYRETSHGSARWSDYSDLISNGNLTAQLGTDRYVLGVGQTPLGLKRGQDAAFLCAPKRFWRRATCLPIIMTGTKDSTIGRPDDGHCITVAGAGGGKGVAVVRPNLMAYGGSVIVLDPKGENFINTVEARERLGNNIYLIDPFKTVPQELRARYEVRFNPLEALAQFYRTGQHSEVYDEAGGIADLIVLTTDKEMQPHFNEKAKSFIRGAILFTTYAEVYQNRSKYPLNLVTVKQCIYHWFSAPEKIKLFLEICNETPRLKAVAGTISMIAGEERANVLSTVLRHMEFLDSPNVQESVRMSDFYAGALKHEKMSVYLVLPANQIKVYSRLARVWTGTLLRALMQDTDQPQHRILCMLDEIGQLGKLEPLQQAMTLGRGYGLDVWVLFQDVHQMKEAYGETYKSFFANAKYQQFFAVRDYETAKYLSDCLGKQTIQTTAYTSSRGQTNGWSSGSSRSDADGQSSNSNGQNSSVTETTGTSISSMGRELLTPDEIMQMPDSDQLILMANRPPVLAWKYDTRHANFLAALETVAISGASAPRMIADR